MSIRFCLGILAVGPVLALVSPAWADGQHPPLMVALAGQLGIDSTDSRSPALFSDRDAVATTELAAQRGGSSFVVPITQAPQTPQVILWDEVKRQAPISSAPTEQGTNVITIQVR
jgi:hypothetical protein